jgi:hypothetical protein
MECWSVGFWDQCICPLLHNSSTPALRLDSAYFSPQSFLRNPLSLSSLKKRGS